jgi:molybdopterin synthase catalytic subunit
MGRNLLINGPVSGIIIASLLEEMGKKTLCGGHSLFLGQVRADEVEGKTVRAIDYTAYEGMVEAEATKIKTEILGEFNDVSSVEIFHSAGTVKAGEISLLILVSAGHRKQAIEACSKTVELVKERLPVWKKEVYEDNSHTWK